jgi:hypothetical protein
MKREVGIPQTPEDFTPKQNKIMKTKLTVALVAVLGALALAANAQDNNQSNDGPPQGGGQGMRGQRPPLPAIVKALDANHDGVIDSNEIANASAALKTLDKNGDGKLTPDEFMGPRPQRGGQHGGPGHGQGGPGGDDTMPPSGPPQGDGNTPPSGPPPGDNN